MMALGSVGFFACAVPLSVAWFFACGFLSGLAGGITMVLGALMIPPRLPAGRHGVASGAYAGRSRCVRTSPVGELVLARTAWKAVYDMASGTARDDRRVAQPRA